MAPTDGNARELDVPIKGILVLSRLPFLSPGLASLVTGILIGIAWNYNPEQGLVWISIIGLALIMLATYYFNEYFDYEGDIINRTFIKFSGGSRALPDKMVPRSVARIAGWSSVGALAIIAVTYLIFYFDDYPWLLPMALVGAFCGVFYSHPPFQWAYRGIGEILIGFCYGILAMISGFYIVSGVMETKMVLIGLPASLSIFGVIVANEFPDIEADRAVNKKNLVVRLGLGRASKMYMIAMVLVYPMMVASAAVGVSNWISVFGLPVLLLCAIAIGSTTGGGYAEPRSQMRISGATLFANLLSSLLFVPVVMLW
ncbi:MAG: prenyltransferase [Thermoplasmata archaeon]